MPRSKQWGVRIYLRDGSTQMLGPFASRSTANANRPGGSNVLSTRVFRFHADVAGPPRLLDNRKTVTETPAVFTVAGVNAPGDPGEVRMTGAGFSTLERWVVKYDGDAEEVEFNDPYETDGDTQIIDTDSALRGETVSSVELHDGEGLKLTVPGLSVLIPKYRVDSVSSPADNQVQIDGAALADVERVDVWYDSNNSFVTINAPFVSQSATSIIVEDLVIGGQTVSQVDLWDDDSLELEVTGLSVPVAGGASQLGYALLGHAFSSNQGGYGISKDTVGRIVVAASVSDGGVGNSAGTFRLDGDGVLDPNWGGDGLVSLDLSAVADLGGQGVVVSGNGNVFTLTSYYDGAQYNGELLKYLDGGALDTGFDGDGRLVTNGPGANAQQCVFVENSNGYVVVGSNSNDTDGVIDRYDEATGAAVDGYAFTPGLHIRGMHQIASGQYLVALADGSNNGYLSLVDIDLQTENTQPQSAVPMTNGQNFGRWGVTAAGGAYYVSGKDPLGSGIPKVAKYDGALQLDTNFGTGGVLTINPGDWLDGGVEHLVAVPGGDIIACGWYGDNAAYGWMTARFDSSGALVPSYGASGIAEVNPGSTDAMIYAAVLDNDDNTKLLVTGYTNPGTAETVVGRINVSDGTLDTTFGDAV